MTAATNHPSGDSPPGGGQTHLRIGVTRLPHAAGLNMPSYATAQSAGLDLAAAIDAPVVLAPGERRLLPTGLILHLPAGYEGQIRPRSGLALKYGITCLNAPGTIDADYRGEVGVILINHGGGPITIDRGMRIAQLVIAPVVHATLVEAATLEEATPPGAMAPPATHAPGDGSGRIRGAGGFGSTGTAAVGSGTRGEDAQDRDDMTETKR